MAIQFGKERCSRLISSFSGRQNWTQSTVFNDRSKARLGLVSAASMGVPLTCFTKKGAQPTDRDFLLRNEQVNKRIAEAFETEGADAWYKQNAKERFLKGLENPDHYNQVFDILDVWFDSGSTHAFVLRDRDDGSDDGFADLYLEGTDQHRGWFHSSMLQSCGTRDGHRIMAF